MDCDHKHLFVSIYLFQNGVACKPEKLRIRRNLVEKEFEQNGKFFSYKGKA